MYSYFELADQPVFLYNFNLEKLLLSLISAETLTYKL